MAKNQKDMKSDDKNANHAKDIKNNNMDHQKSTDHKLDNKKDGLKKQDDKKSPTSSNK